MDSNEVAQKLCKLIAYAGDSKSSAIEAMEAGRAFNLKQAESLMAKSDESLLISQRVQLELMTSEARGEDLNISMLLLHAVSIFAAAEVSNIFAKQYIELCKVLNDQISLRGNGS